jgi:hypothetical protein
MWINARGVVCIPWRPAACRSCLLRQFAGVLDSPGPLCPAQVFEDFAWSDKLRLDWQLRPGDIQLLSNHTCLRESLPLLAFGLRAHWTVVHVSGAWKGGCSSWVNNFRRPPAAPMQTRARALWTTQRWACNPAAAAAAAAFEAHAFACKATVQTVGHGPRLSAHICLVDHNGGAAP